MTKRRPGNPIAKRNPNLSQEWHKVCFNPFCSCHKNNGIKINKPKDYFEAQENLSEAFKQLGTALDKSFHITPCILGINKKCGWIERKIANYKFNKSMCKIFDKIIKGKEL